MLLFLCYLFIAVFIMLSLFLSLLAEGFVENRFHAVPPAPFIARKDLAIDQHGRRAGDPVILALRD